MNGSYGTHKSSKRNCTISTGIPNWGVWCKKWFNWTSRVGRKNATPTLIVLRNLTRTPPKHLRILATPRPWKKQLTLRVHEHFCSTVQQLPFDPWQWSHKIYRKLLGQYGHATSLSELQPEKKTNKTKATLFYLHGSVHTSSRFIATDTASITAVWNISANFISGPAEMKMLPTVVEFYEMLRISWRKSADKEV